MSESARDDAVVCWPHFFARHLFTKIRYDSNCDRQTPGRKMDGITMRNSGRSNASVPDLARWKSHRSRFLALDTVIMYISDLVYMSRPRSRLALNFGHPRLIVSSFAR